ncbi:MAG: methyltransferase domain-containing protein [Actinomycetes bacterium]
MPVVADVPESGAERAQQQSARRAYNRMSRIYGWLSDSSEREFIDKAIDGLLKPQPGEVICEPGFGTGQVLAALAELVGPNGKVYGIDISDGMLERARDRLSSLDLLERVDLRRGSATDLPYADAQFDAVFASFTLELFDDASIPVVLGQIRRVLKPGGRLCVACMSSNGPDKAFDNAMEKLYTWSHSRFPTFVDCRPIDAPAWLGRGGFQVRDVEQLSMWGLAVDLVLAEPGGSAA